MPRYRAIIGVIGGNNLEHVAPLAKAFGRKVAERGHFILTGGSPEENTNVKDAALSGAQCHDPNTRFIGILPRPEGEHQLEPRFEEKEPHSLLLHSGLTSCERDVINGFTPDFLVVFAGGEGTLCELAFAVLGGKPIIFVHSRSLFKTRLAQRGCVAKALLKFPQKGLDAGAILEKVREKLNEDDEDFQTVDRAAKLLFERLDGQGYGASGFPEIPNYPGIRKRFADWLRLHAQA